MCLLLVVSTTWARPCCGANVSGIVFCIVMSRPVSLFCAPWGRTSTTAPTACTAAVDECAYAARPSTTLPQLPSVSRRITSATGANPTNDETPPGFGPVPCNAVDGVRLNTGFSYLLSAFDRPRR